MGVLHLVSTPIGNLRDVSERARATLEAAALVLAEDTRRTGILMRHLELGTPLLSLHEHNEAARVGRVLGLLEDGAELALVSDAGTPGISDPGDRLVRAVLDAGFRVSPVPGPSAVLAALPASGLPSGRFLFLGFLPRKGGERRELVDRVVASRETVVLFESPERLSALLDELVEITAGEEREAAVARELTKLHEEIRRGTLDELARYYREHPPRGEITLLVGPRPPSQDEHDVDDEVARLLAETLLRRGTSPSATAREVARRLGMARNQAYRLLQSLDTP